MSRNRADHSGISELNELTQQGAAERRVLRSGYVAIQNLISEKREDIAKVDSKKFISVINEVEDLHQQVRKPREQVADAEALLELASTLVSSAKTHTSEGVTPSDFISCLLRDFGKQHGKRGSSENAPISVLWKDIGFAVSPIFKNGRGCCTMLGPMKNEIKKRKVAVSRKRARPIKSSRPEELDSTLAEVKTDTDKNMSTMFEILRKKKSVKLESLLLNRKSFAQTVENLFSLSFLVKDGRAVMVVDEKGSQLVSPRNAPTAGQVTYHHFVFRFDFRDWKLMMDSVPDGEELMPHRDVPNISGGSQLEPVPKHSQAAIRAIPIRKFSRNHGLVIVQPDLIEDSPEIGDGTTGIHKYKHEPH